MDVLRRKNEVSSNRISSASLERFLSVVSLAVGRNVSPDEPLHINSILAVRLVSMVRRDLDLNLELAVLFQDRNPRELLQLVKKNQPNQQHVMLKRQGRKASYPLSRNQQRLLAVHSMNPEGSSYNIPIVQRFFKTRVDDLKSALHKVVERHSTLRLVFDLMNVSQSVSTSIPPISEAAMSPHLVEDMLSAPFDVSKSCFRAALAVEDHETVVLIFVVHHIICDGLSVVRLLQDLLAFLDKSPLPPLEFEFVDYADAEPKILTAEMVGSLIRQFRSVFLVFYMRHR